MILRTHDSIWWPGISEDIQNLRKSCLTCHQNAPSQSPQPAHLFPIPNIPFKCLAATISNTTVRTTWSLSIGTPTGYSKTCRHLLSSHRNGRQIQTLTYTLICATLFKMIRKQTMLLTCLARNGFDLIPNDLYKSFS